MPTTEDLRTALSDLATRTDPLPAADLLRRGRRHRLNRRLLAASGSAAAVVAVVAAVAWGPWRPAAEPVPVVAAPATSEPVPVTSAVPPAPALRFTFGPEENDEPGVRASVITDRTVPADIAEDMYWLHRVPGDKTPADAGAETDLGGVRVRMTKDKIDAGYQRQLDWTADGNRYILTVTDVRGDDDRTYGTSTPDLAWLVHDITGRFRGKP